MAGSTTSSAGSKSSVRGSHHPPNRTRLRAPEQRDSAPLDITEEEGEDEVVRPTRDTSRGLGVQKAIAKNGGKKLPVNFDYKGKTYKAIGDNDAEFHNHIGQVVRDLFPPYVHNWRNVDEDLRVQVYPRIRQIFDFKDGEHVRAMVKRESMSRFRDWKTDLYAEFEYHGGLSNPEVAKKFKPRTVKTLEDWHKCIERFCSEEFQKIRSRNKENRTKKKTNSRQGTKSYASHRHVKRNKETGEPQSIMDNWKDQHVKDGVWMDDISRQLYEKMETQREQATQAASEAGSTREICMIETEVIESVLKSGRGHIKAVGPVLGKSVQMAADLSEAKISTSLPREPQLPPHIYKWLGELAQYTSALTAAVKEFNPNFSASMPVPPPEIFRANHAATPASSSNPTSVANNEDANPDDVVLGD